MLGNARHRALNPSKHFKKKIFLVCHEIRRWCDESTPLVRGYKVRCPRIRPCVRTPKPKWKASSKDENGKINDSIGTKRVSVTGRRRGWRLKSKNKIFFWSVVSGHVRIPELFGLQRRPLEQVQCTQTSGNGYAPCGQQTPAIIRN